MDDVAREIYEERAAILEFCAGYSRRDAERIAREQLAPSLLRGSVNGADPERG